MEKVNRFVLYMAACMFALFGCAGVSVERGAQDNVFTSSAPKIAVQINPDFKYMGKFEVNHLTPTTFGEYEGKKVPVTYICYLYCEFGEDQKIQNMCRINFSEIHDWNTVQPHAPLKSQVYDITPGQLVEMEKTDHEPFIIVDNPLSYGLNTYIYEAGYLKDLLTARCYLYKTVIRRISKDAKIAVVVDYAEAIENGETCQGWDLPLIALTEGKQERLAEFIRNSVKNVEVLAK